MALEIFLKQEDSGINGTHQSLNITRLEIFGLGDRVDVNCFPVVQVGPGLWKVERSIEL